ncbi:hypothetical protein BDR03DRAFT_943991 [Suillus americanus]|nr:hypothetical protein BDR03DRAFT_943991 [Suillus americanus]
MVHNLLLLCDKSVMSFSCLGVRLFLPSEAAPAGPAQSWEDLPIIPPLPVISITSEPAKSVPLPKPGECRVELLLLHMQMSSILPCL